MDCSMIPDEDELAMAEWLCWLNFSLSRTGGRRSSSADALPAWALILRIHRLSQQLQTAL